MVNKLFSLWKKLVIFICLLYRSIKIQLYSFQWEPPKFRAESVLMDKGITKL